MRVKFWMAAAAVCALAPGPALAQPIVIGVSTPQTGVAAVASEWEMWGVNLAVEEINAAGGLLGGRKLELMVLDNKCNPSEAVNVANKLVEAKVVAIEGSHCSSAHLASMKIIADAKIPMITGIASNPQITALSGVGGNVAAALSVAFPKYLDGGQTLQGITAPVTAAALRISRTLGAGELGTPPAMRLTALGERNGGKR